MKKWKTLCCLLTVACELVIAAAKGPSFEVVQYYGDSDPVAAQRIIPNRITNDLYDEQAKPKIKKSPFTEFGPAKSGSELIKEIYPTIPQNGFVPSTILTNTARNGRAYPARTRLQPQPSTRPQPPPPPPPPVPHRQYLEQKVTRKQEFVKPVVEQPQDSLDQIKITLAAAPVNVLPLNSPSFATVRNEVQTLKQKQQKYFGEYDYIDEDASPVYVYEVVRPHQQQPQQPLQIQSQPQIQVQAPHQPQPVITKLQRQPSIEYSIHQTFGEKKPPSSRQQKKVQTISKNIYSIDDFGKNDRKLTIDKLAELDKYKLKSAESSSESDSDSTSSSEEDGNSSSSEEGDSSSSEEDEKRGGGEVTDGEFPVNYYSQVRHFKGKGYLPPQANDPRIREKISTKKTNIVYSEQGYNDKTYDHGGSAKLYEVHQRYRRDLSSTSETKNGAPTAAEGEEEFEEEIEALPIPLGLTGNQTSNLNGEELLAYIQEVIRNSSKYLPDDEDDNSFTSLLLNSAEIKKLFTPPNDAQKDATDSIALGSHPQAATVLTTTTTKFPYYNLPETQASALRYAEHPLQFPSPDQSYYATKNSQPCEEIDQDINPVPESLANGDEHHTGLEPKKEIKKKKRLNQLGKKINCFKRKYFGDDPLDNPLFKEEFITGPGPTANIRSRSGQDAYTSNTGQSFDHYSNPSINVYDDVISNIRSAIVAENANANNKNRISILKLKPKSIDSEASASTHNQTVVPASGLDLPTVEELSKEGAVFDISKYLPKIYYEPENGVLYRIRYKKKKKKKKAKTSDNVNRDSQPQQSKDYTVFPKLEFDTKQGYIHRDSEFDYSNRYYHVLPKGVTYLHPNNHRPQSLSSGYYPYPVLASKRKKFHYESVVSI